MTTPTILVPLDGSRFAECALPFAIQLASKLNGQISLASVSPKKRLVRRRRTETISAEALNADVLKRSEYLDRTVEKIAGVSTVRASSTVLFGAAARQLVNYSNTHQPDVIVMSTHGRGPLSRAWLGSVADWLVRHVPMPVLLVRPVEGDDVDLAVVNGFRNILVALDGSKQAEESVKWAKAFGDEDTIYTLIRVARDSIPVWTVDYSSAPFDIRDYSKAGIVEASEYLSHAEQLFNESRQSPISVVVEGMPAAVGILQIAKERAVDLIAITTHGRGGLPRLLLGSVSDKVVRASPAPVLVVRPQPR